MTCIAAIEHSAGVAIGCDAFFGTDEWRDVVLRPKWVRRGRSLLIASSGSLYFGQVAEGIMQYRGQRKREDDHDYVVNAVIEPIRLAHDACKIKQDDDNLMMVIYNGSIYTVLGYGIVRSGSGYAAIGIGDKYALGSMASTDGPPAERVEKALKAAAKHCPSVCRPFTVIDVPKL